MPASGRDACPGCGMRHAPLDGPTHRYIGASPACWALFAPLTVGDVPDAALLADTRVPPEIAVPSSRADPTLGVLLVDAYAAQHAGVPSPQAVQSVAVHLLAMHGVIERGLAASQAMWIRRRALRTRGAFAWLSPPSPGEALTVRHLFAGGGVVAPVTSADYVRSVHDAWRRHAGETIDAWYARYVAAE